MSFGRLTLSFSSISIRRFNALMETRKLSEAADRLSLTVPTASRMLGQMREIIGDELFTRFGRGLVPTKFAAALSARVTRLLEDYSALHRTAPFSPGDHERTFRIACVVNAAFAFLQHAMLDIMKKAQACISNSPYPAAKSSRSFAPAKLISPFFPSKAFWNIRFAGTRRQVRCTFRRRLQDFGFFLSDAAPGARRRFPFHRRPVALVQQPNPTAPQAGSALLRLLELPSAAGLRLEDKLFCK